MLARLRLHRTRTRKRVTPLHQRRFVAVLRDIEALQPRLSLEALHQRILSTSQVLWLSDGARALSRLFHERFVAYATGILHFYHAVQNLWKRAAASLHSRTTQARRSLRCAPHRLLHSNPDPVLAHLAHAFQLEPLPATARETLRTVYAYLHPHRNHIDYAVYNELRLPIVSAIVQSACKWLIQQRFKVVPMRSSEHRFNHLLHLTLAC